MKSIWLLPLVLLTASGTLYAAPTITVNDCEETTGWDADATVVASPVQAGDGAIRWTIAESETLRYTPETVIDMSGHDALRFWVHANHPHAEGGSILLYLGSENPAVDGIDYYSASLVIDWSGWRQFEIELQYLAIAREPLGLAQIDEISFRASGWDNVPDPTLVLHVDQLELVTLDQTAPRTTDEELFAALDLSLPGLEAVAAAVDTGDYELAKTALCAYFRQRTEPAWFFDPHEVDTSVGFNAEIADSAVNSTFSIVGYTYTFADGVIDWSYNPTIDASVADNNEWTWQLARMNYWSDMGKAWWATGDDVYAETFAAQLESFVTTRRVPNVAANGAGSSWRTIEAGIRGSGSWPDAWYRFLLAPAFDDEHMILMLKSFYEHGQYLRQFQTSANWLTHELDGLYTVGAVFPEFKEAGEWREFAVNAMVAALDEQFLADGGHYELSPGYHQVALSHIAGLYEVAQLTGNSTEVPEDYLTRLAAAFLWPVQIATPNFDNPYLNDSWKVDVARASELPHSLFPDDPVFAWAASGREEGDAPEWKNLLLPDSGLVVMRSGWEADAQYALFDVGPYSRGHSHQDKLNLVLFSHGRNLLFDSGGGNYEKSDFRDYGLDTHSHNTVLVDNLPQRRERDLATDPLGWGNPETTEAHFHTQDSHAYAVGYYQDAYGDEGLYPASHRRELLYVKPDVFLVVDTLVPLDDATHEYEARWHLMSDTWSEDELGIVTTDADQPNLAVIPLATEGLTVHGDSGLTEPELLGWNLEHTSGSSPALTVRHQRSGKGVQRFVTLLAPLATGVDRIVDSIESIDELIWRVHFTDGTDIEFSLAEGDAPGIDVILQPTDGDAIAFSANPSQKGSEFTPEVAGAEEGCGCGVTGRSNSGSLALLLIGLGILWLRRSRRT